MPSLSTPAADGPTCARSALPPWMRLAITFGVLFALKHALPMVGMPRTPQVLVLLAVATLLAWRFWWHCSPNRRGALLLVGVLWMAGLAKIALG